MTAPVIQIRRAESENELHACAALQQAVWSLPAAELVPFHQLHAAHAWGGSVHLAVDGDRPIGFCYGFAGAPSPTPTLCSHMLGVLPEYRGQQIGLRLKLAQAEWAKANGYARITWTFDPLEALNAQLNIARLGAIVRTYLVDYYGPMHDRLNQGLPSDRLLAEWQLDRPTVLRILAGESPPAPPTGQRCPIPPNIQAVKRVAPAAAHRWRLQVRSELQAALAQGLAITGFADSGYILTPLEEEHHAD